MSEKVMKEWFLDVPWGKLARHGRSEPQPGPPISYLHFVEVIRQIVEQLHWDTFYCIAHSMGYLICSYYNGAYPGRIRRLVVLAGVIGIGLHGLTDLPKQWFQLTYANFYNRYYPPPPPISYTYEKAVSVLATARGVSEELGAVLAKRCLEPASDGKFRFTWDAKAKKIFTVVIPEETLCSVLSTPTPTLCIVPTEDQTAVPFPDYTADVLAKVTNKLVFVEVPGGHNVHMSHPERVLYHVVGFLFDVKAKL